MLPQDSQPKKILLIRLSALGDILFALPLFRQIRENFPEAHLTWLVDDRSASVLHDYPGIDRLWVLPRKAWARSLRRPANWRRVASEATGFFRDLRRESFDICLDVQGNLKSGILSRMTRAPRRIGFDRPIAREGNRFFNTERISVKPPRIHRIERDLQLLRGLGLNPEFARPELPVSKEDAQSIRDRLLPLVPDLEAPDRAPLLLLHPGTSKFGDYKRWSPENYGRVAADLSRRTRCTIFVSWGPGEEDLARRVEESSCGTARVAPPTDSLGQLSALIQQADLMVAADTGPLHIASLMGIPVVALFGPKDPILYAPSPLCGPVEVVRAGVSCSPCTLRQCDLRICMSEIGPEEVVEKVLGLLKERRAHDPGRTRDPGQPNPVGPSSP